MNEIRVIVYGTEDYEKMVSLRNDVLRVPLGLSFTRDYLEKDQDVILLGCFKKETMVGCCMLRQKDLTTFQLQQMAVKDDVQGQGIGTEIVRFAEKLVKDQGGLQMFMHARKYAVPFYEKLGYKISGGEFEEVTIPHLKMYKNID
ncbi:GNAT family N-acetyltransferase [Pedobacter sp. SYSU D00535]|uniref:GNAT family N-acetyltransferase n=1 Tax=Pedobacter sp. SYSU D00535 TaxID=2810308 RepID=UPI001A975BD7|nr:GNAT family N-acetyltransferase [Pedobacter sp. SYSU D00535]